MQTVFEIASVACFFGSIAALLFNVQLGIYVMLAAIFLQMIAKD